MRTSYRVEKSEVGEYARILAQCETFAEAVAVARAAGARGEAVKNGPCDWCFSGGSAGIGYWITAECAIPLRGDQYSIMNKFYPYTPPR